MRVIPNPAKSSKNVLFLLVQTLGAQRIHNLFVLRMVLVSAPAMSSRLPLRFAHMSFGF